MIILLIITATAFLLLAVQAALVKESGETVAVLAKRKLLELSGRPDIRKYFLSKQEMIVRCGIDYKHGKHVTLQGFYGYKLLYGLLFTALVLALNIWLHMIPVYIYPIAFFVGWFYEELSLKSYNKKENDHMMKDVQEMFRSFVYSQKGGQSMSGSISTSAMVVESKRLKEALIDLYSSLQVNKDTEMAIESFESRFENTYISAFAVTLKQMLSTGKSDEMLMSLQKSISDLEIAINVTKKDQLDLRQTFYALILFGTAIGLVMFLFMQNLGNITGVTG